MIHTTTTHTMTAATSAALPAIENYDKLVPIAHALYVQTNHLAWEMLLPFFLISVAIGYSSELGITGSVLVRLKRLVIVVLLLVAFPTIAQFAQSLGVEIARSIDNMAGIDMILHAAAKRAAAYSFSLKGLLNMTNDFATGFLVLVTYLILVVARYFLLAFQHFFWLLLMTLGPFMILASLFESAAGITKNLFKSMFELSCWPIIWAILSAFLKSVPFAHVYGLDPSRITVITLNLIIAVALLFSPFMISHFTGGVVHSAGDSIRRGVLKTAAYANPKTLAASKIAGGATKATKQFTPKPPNKV